MTVRMQRGRVPCSVATYPAATLQKGRSRILGLPIRPCLPSPWAAKLNRHGSESYAHAQHVHCQGAVANFAYLSCPYPACLVRDEGILPEYNITAPQKGYPYIVGGVDEADK